MYIPDKKDRLDCLNGISCDFGICDECQLKEQELKPNEKYEIIKSLQNESVYDLYINSYNPFVDK